MKISSWSNQHTLYLKFFVYLGMYLSSDSNSHLRINKVIQNRHENRLHMYLTYLLDKILCKSRYVDAELILKNFVGTSTQEHLLCNLNWIFKKLQRWFFLYVLVNN